MAAKLTKAEEMMKSNVNLTSEYGAVHVQVTILFSDYFL